MNALTSYLLSELQDFRGYYCIFISLYIGSEGVFHLGRLLGSCC